MRGKFRPWSTPSSSTTFRNGGTVSVERIVLTRLGRVKLNNQRDAFAKQNAQFKVLHAKVEGIYVLVDEIRTKCGIGRVDASE